MIFIVLFVPIGADLQSKSDKLSLTARNNPNGTPEGLRIGMILRAVLKLENLLRREPSDKEVAEYLDFPLLTIKHLRHVKVHNVSLQQKLTSEADSGELQDQIKDDKSVLAADTMEAVEELSTLKKYFEYLKDREKLILTMRFGL